jgi:hypothetical protein
METSGHAASVAFFLFVCEAQRQETHTYSDIATDARGTQLSDPVLALIQPDRFRDLNLHPDTGTEEY